MKNAQLLELNFLDITFIAVISDPLYFIVKAGHANLNFVFCCSKVIKHPIKSNHNYPVSKRETSC